MHHNDNHEYVEPYLVQTMKTMIGTKMVIETSRGSVRGTLTDVKPDHVVLQASKTSFFIRLQEIVWVMPL
ncbi:YuzF family protein [Halalkalibacter urbisdiaboli]|uniref:YuzF family protein n=1 Tax=Halalkalibacter urbisdiaboli TaxID=1960589 RepID=UPI000B42D854|nr:YuzF family protein [Halalkalibacter urbisdiaboli]